MIGRLQELSRPPSQTPRWCGYRRASYTRHIQRNWASGLTSSWRGGTVSRSRTWFVSRGGQAMGGPIIWGGIVGRRRQMLACSHTWCLCLSRRLWACVSLASRFFHPGMVLTPSITLELHCKIYRQSSYIAPDSTVRVCLRCTHYTCA